MNLHFLRDADEIGVRLDAHNARFEGKRILLTGAAGFLGVQFVHYFLRLNDSGRLTRPCHLTAVDNYVRGTPSWLHEFRNRPDITLTRADITKQCDLGEPDFVIHAASIASPTYYRQFPIETMDANVVGLRRLLDHATAHRPEGFLFFSTSEIYGDPEIGRAHV